MEPLYAHTDEGTRAKVFLSILGYLIIAMITNRCGLRYNKAVEAMKGIKEVVYINSFHNTVELTKEQRTLWKDFQLKCSDKIGQR